MIRTTLIAICTSLMAGAALGASATSSAGPVPVTGTVPLFCSLGTVASGDQVFDLGVLINTSTGLLRNDLAPPPKTLSGSFCNTKSVIAIAATPMTAQSFTGTPGSGLSATVDFTATASGWTASPAVFSTGNASNPGANQTQPAAFSGDITVGLSNFLTKGGVSLRLIGDPLYQGTVTVTLAAAS